MQKQENTTYLKAITIRDPSDLHSIKEDIKKGMVEAAQEQDLVTDLCQQWQIPLSVKELDPLQKQTGMEAWARNERYAFFHRIPS